VFSCLKYHLIDWIAFYLIKMSSFFLSNWPVDLLIFIDKVCWSLCWTHQEYFVW
jgi:hypothetical protein